MLDFSPYIIEAGQYAQLLTFILFIAGCFYLWKQTHQISLGHQYIGQFVMVILLIALIMMGFSPQRLTLLRLLIYGSLTIWLAYNGWYFSKYPIPAEYLRASGRVATPSVPIYVPRSALFRYLSSSPSRSRPFWFGNWFRYVALVTVFLFLGAYGFKRTIDAYSWGLQKVAEEKKQSSTQTRQAVSTAIQSVTAAVNQAVDTLAESQQTILRKQDAILKNSKAPATKPKPRTSARPRIGVPPQSIKGKDVKIESRPWWKWSVHRLEPESVTPLDSLPTQLAKHVLY